ncbi:sigma-70 family RNA polymerase sigma factor [Psychrobacillus sp. NPDC096426]|uniref:sigma-70 family RNA polymerase sigma factor n=1 Tax=Psychrobacillus sp. NPDC096426 TaxID=3364491 RepID=UPI00381EFE25
MKITEENVVEQLKLRNEKALFHIVDQYGGTIKMIIQKYLGNLEIIQDECLDDVLLLVWRNIDSYDKSKNTLRNWIAAITKYKAIDYQRQYRKFLNQSELTEEMLVSSNDVEELIIENTLSSQTEKMLVFLKKEDQLLFLQHYVEQKSVEELANERGIDKSVIYNRLSRGRRKLRKLFQNKLNNY